MPLADASLSAIQSLLLLSKTKMLWQPLRQRSRIIHEIQFGSTIIGELAINLLDDDDDLKSNDAT